MFLSFQWRNTKKIQRSISSKEIIVCFCQKVPKSYFQSQFSSLPKCQKSSGFFWFFFHLQFRSTLLEEQFLKTSIFGMFHLLRWCPIFDDSSLYQITKYNFSLYTSLENFLKSSIRIQSEFSYLQKKNYAVYL